MLSSSELGHQGLRVAPFHISSTHRATAFMEDRIPTDKMQGAPSFAETALRSTTLTEKAIRAHHLADSLLAGTPVITPAGDETQAKRVHRATEDITAHRATNLVGDGTLTVGTQ